MRALGLLSAQLRRRFGWLVVIACVASAFEAVGVVVAFGLIQLILEPSKIDSLSLIKPLISFFGISLTDSTFIFAATFMAVFFLIKNVYLAGASYFQIHFSSASGMYLAQAVLGKYLRMPYERMAARNSSELTVLVNHAPYFVSTRILASAVQIVAETLTIFGIIAVLMYNEPIVAATTGLGLGTCMVLFYSALRSPFARWGQEQLSQERLATKTVFEALRGLKEIRIIGCEEKFLQTFRAIRARLLVVNTYVGVVGLMPRFVSETLIIWAIAFVIIVVLTGGRSTIEVLTTLSLFGFAGFRMMPSINRLTMALTTVKNGRASLDQLADDLAEAEAIRPAAPGHDRAAAANFGFADRIAFDAVSFRYSTSQQNILDNVSMNIERGGFIGIVGGSGAGKTTLVDVLMGLLEPQSGTITVDGRPADTSADAWRRLFGYVPQEISLIDDTVLRNICLGVPEAEIDRDKLDNAIRLASIADMIDDLNDGLQTVIGEAGVNLSGGQRQRIGIARALYRDPQILVMDEATSALDTETENKIMDTLHRLAGEKTIVIIAHRLSTVQHCDVLFYFERGRLEGTGSFAELRAANAHFNRMVQFAEITGKPLDGNGFSTFDE